MYRSYYCAEAFHEPRLIQGADLVQQVELGLVGETAANKTNAPGGFSANGPFLGLDIKF